MIVRDQWPLRWLSLGLAVALSTGAAGAAVPTTAPSSQPAVAAADVTVVGRGTLDLSFGTDGVFEPVDPCKVRLAFRRYAGDLTVRTAAANGSRVAKGDVLLSVDADPIDRQIAAAESAADVARAGVAKAESDVALGERSDALAMDTAKQAAADAQAGLKRYDQADAPAAVAAAGLSAKEMDAALDDSTDELDQLRQMYKSEDLTSQTADIVLKRAVRQREIYKVSDQVAKVMADRAATFEPAVHRHGLASAVAAQAQSVDELVASQAQGRVARSGGLVTARAAAADADRAVAELKRDRAALTVTSTVDGVLVYGAFADKAWQPMDPDKLAIDQKVSADQVLMTVYQPGKLKVAAACGQSTVLMMGPGTRVTVRADALYDVPYDGTCGAAVPVAGSSKRDATVDVPVSLPAAVDLRLVPGLYASVAVDVPPAADVLVVPATALFHGRVKVRGPDGKFAPRPVVVGHTRDDKAEVRAGLVDGDTVLTTYGG